MALIDKLTAIGDAIRSKTGTTNLMTLSQMPELINGIETGGGGFPNGTEWTETTGNINVYQASIVYANGLWILYSNDRGTSYPVYYSLDGKEWTQSNISYNDLNNVINANVIWVAGSTSGIYYSLDGKEWTQSNVTYSITHEIVNANGIWIGATVGYGIYYSHDGKEWTISNYTGQTLLGNNIVYANGIWVASPLRSTVLYSVSWE